MLAVTQQLIVFAAEAAEEHVPANDWRTIIGLPAAFIFFFGSIYLLLRSNLGALRAYLVMATAFFGFMVILTLYWAFGAPGTPIATGPQNLPGQPGDYYAATWEPFAADSTIADDRFPLVKSYPEGFDTIGENDEELQDLISGVPAEIQAFFAEDRGGVAGRVADDWVVEGDPQVATAADGAQLIALTFAPPPPEPEAAEEPDAGATEAPEGEAAPAATEDVTGGAGEVGGQTEAPAEEDAVAAAGGSTEAPTDGEAAATEVPASAEGDGGADGEGTGEAEQAAASQEPYTAFAYYDPGFILLPSLIFIALSVIGLILHVLLLGWDENREKRQARDDMTVEEEREPVPAGA